MEQIVSPADVKELSQEQLPLLCDELRGALLRGVSTTGGHLASNLGVVELTVAIHRVFDTSRDRLVFDVGHQCYVHKLLTGRQAQFSTLRQQDGLSGFPKPRESVHDAFIAGHASNSVSVALGMARGRTLQGQDYSVIALLGDGALGGGLSFEGLNDAGTSGEPMIVILNDNGMSISRNVGGISGYLARIRRKPGYQTFKRRYRHLLGGSTAGKRLYRVSHSIKTAVKGSILPGSTFFEHMGFQYIGPVNGHNMSDLIRALTTAKNAGCPVLLHVHTVKGKGYPPAEQEPDRWHSVGPFDIKTGKPLCEGELDFSSVFGATLTELAGEDGRICAITAGMPAGTGLAAFSDAFPRRFFDVGIAEEHAVSMAAGMAKQGLLPVLAVYSTFLQRGFDQLIHDVSLQNLHVVFAVDRAGLVGADGETHHGCFDPAYLSVVPGMTVFSPSDFTELRTMLRQAIYACNGPVAVRYPRGGEAREHCRENDSDNASFTVLRQGGACSIVTYGTLTREALDAAQILHEANIEAQVVQLRRITPLTAQDVSAMALSRQCVLVLEDCVESGCIGRHVAALLAQSGAVPKKLLLQNLGATVPDHGSVAQLYRRRGLDAATVADTLKEALR